ncbi:hypothetical protein HID58_070330 [Brassica napus]|uniref:Uncharacterized protein n=1 Tax=Brassica napus TaxID=3708 RepID=A0ABQ7YYH5_BRANA|nr:hypothetical protein HID58_070330 [Brassica napus]
MPLPSLQGGAFTTIKKPGREKSSMKFSSKSIRYYFLPLIFLLFFTLIEIRVILGWILVTGKSARGKQSATRVIINVTFIILA